MTNTERAWSAGEFDGGHPAAKLVRTAAAPAGPDLDSNDWGENLPTVCTSGLVRDPLFFERAISKPGRPAHCGLRDKGAGGFKTRAFEPMRGEW